jgi:hypothetical protein
MLYSHSTDNDHTFNKCGTGGVNPARPSIHIKQTQPAANRPTDQPTCLSFLVAVAMTLDVNDLDAPPVECAPSTHLTWPWASYHLSGLGRPDVAAGPAAGPAAATPAPCCCCCCCCFFFAAAAPPPPAPGLASPLLSRLAVSSVFQVCAPGLNAGPSVERSGALRRQSPPPLAVMHEVMKTRVLQTSVEGKCVTSQSITLTPKLHCVPFLHPPSPGCLSHYPLPCPAPPSLRPRTCHRCS